MTNSPVNGLLKRSPILYGLPYRPGRVMLMAFGGIRQPLSLSRWIRFGISPPQNVIDSAPKHLATSISADLVRGVMLENVSALAFPQRLLR